MKAYRPLWVILIAFELTFIARVGLDGSKIWQVSHNSTNSENYLVITMQFVNSIFNRIKWFAIFFFILQAQEVCQTLKATSHDEHLLHLKRHQKFRLASLITITVCELATFVCNAFKFTKATENMNEDTVQIIYYTDIVFTGVTLITNMIFSVIFFQILIFYFSSKQKKKAEPKLNERGSFDKIEIKGKFTKK